jgi:hypothetical protein
LSYFNSLGLQKCDLIVAAGQVPIAAMMAGRWNFPKSRYLAIGGDAGNTAVVGGPATSSEAIRSTVRAAVMELT